MSTEEPPSRTPGPTRPPGKQRILIVDDHPVFRKGMAALLAETEEFTVCGEGDSAASALDAMRGTSPDVALVDISMPGTNGIELLKVMLAERPALPVLIVSMHDESLYALRALRAGARGYIMKGEAQVQLIGALRKIVGGGIYLSPNLNERLILCLVKSPDGDPSSPVGRLSDRELEVLQMIGRGTATRHIARTLHLSVKTIETYRAHIKEKLGFKDAAELVRFAVEWTAGQPA